MKLALPFTLAAAFMASHGVEAWGDLAHETIGYIAMEFLDPTALSFVKSILGRTFKESLGPAAIWADEVKFKEEFEFTIPFHFISAHDDPPNNCSVDLKRDCGDAGCSVTAVQNYTKQFLDGTRGNRRDQRRKREQTQQALLFLTSFIGNLGEPLTNEARGRRGFEIAATCDHNDTVLHAVWSAEMVTKNVNNSFAGSPQVYASRLAAQIKDGDYTPEAHGWISDINQSALSGTDVPLTWSKEANTLLCTVVFNFTEGQDLCDSPYYDNAIPVIDRQIAKQGYRLAIWLNTIFE